MVSKVREPEAQPAVVRVVPTVPLEWTTVPGAPRKGFSAGREVEVPRQTAALWVLLQYAAPAGWTLTSEDARAAGPAAFRELEAQREARGLTEDEVQRVPALQAKYQRLAELLGANDDDGPRAA